MRLDEEQQYEQAWAAALVARALERTEKEFDNVAKTRLFHALKPFLTGGVHLPSQGEVAMRLDISIDTFRSHLSRLRGRYRGFLREEVARTIGASEDVDEELRHLCRTLIAVHYCSNPPCHMLKNRFCAANSVVRRLRVPRLRESFPVA